MKKIVMIFFVLLFSLVLISCSGKTTQTSANTNTDKSENGTKDIKENNSDKDIQINFSGTIEKPIEKAKLIDCWSQK
ncbi:MULTISPECIES: hypothetical protein [unclassified Clostridium]|uniref:hypothetical protein n=1 Tax=unclassified Clostridium TaxID=2614128 RepID=UPI000297C85C|nr:MULTISPECIES: hypothetical protein [unclassified Clostridium]EKQ57512.1 MAG: hypothetical protein A370_00887 [Clostridium sp. Maddingley MBC34-26]